MHFQQVKPQLLNFYCIRSLMIDMKGNMASVGGEDLREVRLKRTVPERLGVRFVGTKDSCVGFLSLNSNGRCPHRLFIKR